MFFKVFMALFIYSCRQDENEGQIPSCVHGPPAAGAGERVPLQSLHHHQTEGRTRRKPATLRTTSQNLVPEPPSQRTETKQEAGRGCHLQQNRKLSLEFRRRIRYWTISPQHSTSNVRRTRLNRTPSILINFSPLVTIVH